jgi:hypothetical protein
MKCFLFTIKVNRLYLMLSIFTAGFTFNSRFLFSQSVYPLVSGITVDSILLTQPGASKMAMDAVSGHLFYATANGNIYEVFIPGAGVATDSLRYTNADHGIGSLQGLYFRDSVMYICGNNWFSTTTVAKIMKGVLQPNGTRQWIDVLTTDPYPSASSYGDHGFTGINLDPAGNYIYVSSGARTHLGEVRTNGGAWPGYREVPMTSKIFRLPVATTGLTLPNDSAFLDSSGYVFTWGTRNAYDMAWDGNDTLFAIDNSGERDDPEELNWLQEGKHYGFPWKMGGNYNPLMNSPYDVDLDPLVNPLCGGYLNGWFADDPGFPPAPAVTFIEPVRNYGTEADFFRDSITGEVKNASDEGTYITSFTAHRSPVGLLFDRDSMMAEPYRGDGFVMSFMPGGDSAGYTSLSPWGSPCPFVDSSRELVQMQLTYNSSIGNYTMTTNNIAGGFYLPVDAELVGNVIYVIEHNGDIWKITLPLYVGISEVQSNARIKISPNPTLGRFTISFDGKLEKLNSELKIYTVAGSLVHQQIITEKSEVINQSFSPGVYFITVSDGERSFMEKLIVSHE